MKSHEPFFIVEDSLDQKLDDIAPLIHDDLSKSDYLEHFDLGKIFQSKSKYKGGFKKGKNTKEYNHDYYIHNKDKWKKDGETEEMTLDELKELGLTEEQIKNLNLDVNSKGVFIVPTEWITDFISGGKDAVNALIDSVKNAFSSIFGKKAESPEEEHVPDKYDYPPSPFVKDPKTIDDPQNLPVYSVEFEDQSGRSSQTLDLDFDYVDYYKDFAIKDRPMSVKEDAAAVNPNYDPKSNDGYSNNCAWCSYTYDLRRRGYDVQAPCDDAGLTNLEITTFYKDTSIHDFKQVYDPNNDYYENTELLFNQLKAEGDGARGILTVSWLAGGGHAMSWEVVNGEAYVVDAQTNSVMSEGEFYWRAARIDWGRQENLVDMYPYDDLSDPEVYINLSGCAYLRTDNRELNTTGVLQDYERVYETADDGTWIYHQQKTETTRDLASTIISNPQSDESKEIWKKVNEANKHGRVKKKTKKRRKKTADEYRRS